jgi:hypothetical protein
MGSVDDALAAKIGCEVIWRFSWIIGSKVQSDIANELLSLIVSNVPFSWDLLQRYGFDGE